MRAVGLILAGVLMAVAAPPGLPAPPPPASVGTADVDFAAIRLAGADTVKLLADWSAIEPQRGRYSWAALDAAVRAATRAGLKVALVLAHTPQWASLATGLERQDPLIYSRQPPRPDRLPDWGAFVRAAVTRYRGQVKDWQVWTALSLPLFRGTAGEYLALLRTAREQAKRADPASRIILATPLGIDLVSIRKAVLEAPAAFDAVSLAPRGLAPEALLRPLAVLRQRVLARAPKAVWIEWDLRALGDRQSCPAQVLKVMAIARALGVERVAWASDLGPGGAALRTFGQHVGDRPLVGYVTGERALLLDFGETAPVGVGWSAVAGSALKVDGPPGQLLTAAGETRPAEAGTIPLDPQPVIVTGLSAALVEQARAQLAAQGPPLLPEAVDFSQAAEVSARLGRTNIEQGLYNMRFRGVRNGAVEVVEVAGSEAVRTDAAREVVFIYFDVDDSFLYYVDGRSTVEVAVEVLGASAPGQLGFNLLYDSMTGYRFTPWRTVEEQDGWVTYTFPLADAAFANTWGWDFAINAAGNRRENLTVRSVTVRKAPRP